MRHYNVSLHSFQLVTNESDFCSASFQVSCTCRRYDVKKILDIFLQFSLVKPYSTLNGTINLISFTVDRLFSTGLPQNPRAPPAHSKGSISTLQGLHQHTPRAPSAHSKGSISTLQGLRQQTPRALPARSKGSISTLQGLHQHTPRAPPVHSKGSISTLQGLHQHTQRLHQHSQGAPPEAIQMLRSTVYFNSPVQISEQGFLEPLGHILGVPLHQKG